MFSRRESFDPETLAQLSAALRLATSGASVDRVAYEAMALRIITAADAGECDIERLAAIASAPN